MSSESKQEAPPKKGKGMMTKLIMGVGLLALGGGGAYGLQLAGLLPGGHSEAKEVDNSPKLILKGEVDPYAAPAEGEKEAVADVPGDGGSKFRTSYFIFSDDFTSNLRGSTGLVQLSLAAATQHDGRVIMWLKKHELAVRSAILIELADTPEEELLTQAGKEQLQKRLVDAINGVLMKQEGFGGISAVYFRSLLVQ